MPSTSVVIDEDKSKDTCVSGGHFYDVQHPGYAT